MGRSIKKGPFIDQKLYGKIEAMNKKKESTKYIVRGRKRGKATQS